MPKSESGTKVILEDPRGRLLCLLRDNNPNIPFPNHWDFTGGGLEPGETLLQCGEREVEEEIGLRGLKLRMLDVVPSRFYPDVVFGRAYGRLTAVQAGSIIRTSEGQRFGFFTPAEIADLHFVPPLQEYVLALYGIANRVMTLERTA